MIDKNLDGIDNQMEKAYYRRGLCYMLRGDLKNAKEDLVIANEIAQSKNPAILHALEDLREKE